MAYHPLVPFLSDVAILTVGFSVRNIAKNRWPAFHRGFFCDDKSLMYPYSSSTVLFWKVVFVGLTANFIVIFVFIPIRLYLQRRCSCFNKDTILLIFRTAWPSVFLLLSGMFITTILTDILKSAIGRLRPHFFAVCQPVYNGSCTAGQDYITLYKCVAKGYTKRQLRHLRKSFPSGHCSSAVYFAMAFVLFLQDNMRQRHLFTLRCFIQSVSFVAAFYVSCTRISDYMHHWSDVLGGVLLGIVVPLVLKSILGNSEHFEVNNNEASHPT